MSDVAWEYAVPVWRLRHQFCEVGPAEWSGPTNLAEIRSGAVRINAFTPDNGPIAQTDPWKDRLDLVERVADRHAFER